jgi:hypothetical protein
MLLVDVLVCSKDLLDNKAIDLAFSYSEPFLSALFLHRNISSPVRYPRSMISWSSQQSWPHGGYLRTLLSSYSFVVSSTPSITQMEELIHGYTSTMVCSGSSTHHTSAAQSQESMAISSASMCCILIGVVLQSYFHPICSSFVAGYLWTYFKTCSVLAWSFTDVEKYCTLHWDFDHGNQYIIWGV